MIEHGAVMHELKDDVAVAIRDLVAGNNVKVMTIKGKDVGTVKVIENIPLGHKLSVRNIAQGEDVIKYGYAIGRAITSIPKGAHVHTHNIISKRWA